ncbi:MAG: tetratricopeptide repeat protein [Ramlibacter sp.]|nr:tetratricopeptide repeat protein [Ramlibacter sp.]
MERPSSYSVAPGDASRSRVLSWGALLGMVALAAGGLALVFPRADLLTLLRGETDQGNRELTVAYLRNIIRTEPRDLGLRLLLAEKLLAGGDLLGARQVLNDAQALANASAVAQGAWDAADLSWWQARLRQAQTRDRDEETHEAAAELVKRLRIRVAAVATPAQVFAARQTALALQAALGSEGGPALDEARAIGRDLLRRLLNLPAAGLADLSRGATMAVADGQFTLASELYFAARRKTAPRDARDQLLRKGVQALLAGGQPLVAWQAAVREALPLPAGDPLYWWLAELALGAAQPREAAVHLRQVVPPQASPAELARTLTPAQRQTAWDTFAAAGDLKAALRVADAALVAEPQSVSWLERKAQVAEWAGLAPQALAAWLELLKRGASERALANVFRLSPMLYDDDALLAAWLALRRQRPLSLAEVEQVVQAYERLGSVDGALGFVRQLAASQPGADPATRAAWQSLQARLLERAGRPAEAIALLEQLRPDGLARDDAMRLAQLHLRQGQMPLALRALRAARLAPGPFDDAYWDLVADTAYETGERAVALDALDRLIASGRPAPYQAERAIRLRLDDDRDAEALALAAQLYRRFPGDAIVYAWLDAIAGQPRPTGLDGLLSTLTPEHRQKLERSPVFLERRAGLYARLGEVALARRDYEQGLRLRPDHAPTRVAYWWLLIDQQDSATLRAELARVGARARNDLAYGEVLAAAWQLLDEPRLALALLQPAARAHASDFLWLMNYADVLERAGREAPALRVRRHAWLLAQQAARRPAGREQGRQALAAQLRLAPGLAGGPQKERLWRELGQWLAASGDDAAARRQASELVGAWLLSEGRFDAAQRWLWQQQAQRMALPAYQTLALAISQEDPQAMAQLLDRASGPGADRIDPQDRLTALRLLGRRGEAAALGTAQAQRRPEGPGDEAQQALQDDLLAGASRVGTQVLTRRAGVIARREVRIDTSVALAPRLRLTLALTEAGDRSRDAAQIAATPAHDRELRAGIETATPWGDLKAQWLVRDALATVQGLFLQLSTQLNPRARLQLEAARNERSDESSAMAVAGARDSVAASLNLRLNERLEAQASLAASRLRTQTGAGLGRTVDAALTGQWVWRRDYPDVRLQIQLRRSVVRVDGQPDPATAVLVPGGGVPSTGLFLGPSSSALSASLGVGLAQADPSIYSRAWRPWGEIGLETRRSPTGQQTQGLLRLGAKGSVAGRDQLSVHLDIRPGTGGLSGSDDVRELRLQYETFFDR